MIRIPFDNSYSRLPERFYFRTPPTPVRAPRLVRLNRALALELGIEPDALSDDDAASVFSGNLLAAGSDPIALAYAGHQFGNFVPQLGDGRAVLLGEVVDIRGSRRDLQLKGAGRTRWSRGGDGRAALGPVLREYLVSEAMATLGIATTRALAAVITGEGVMREEPLPGAVLTRVASSHVRVGTFEYFARRGDDEAVRLLADHVIGRHYPSAAKAEQPYLALLAAVVEAQARLVASWLLVGFIHGVMNTDNMSISGETIDYGPCAFLDHYDPRAVFSAIDRTGRYAYANQPSIATWNLTRLAECLLPLLSGDEAAAVTEAESTLAGFAPAFQKAYLDGLRRKLGMFTADDDDAALAQDLLDLMQTRRADFTLTFRNLGEASIGEENLRLRELFGESAPIAEWVKRWQLRLAQEEIDPAVRREAMRRTNPLYIPRNHRIEAVIRAAVDRDDFAPFDELVNVLSKPFDDQPEFAHYANPPLDTERVLQTFCGT